MTALAGVATADVVIRRGNAEPLTGDVQTAGDRGVTVRSSFGAVHVVSWDRVADVRMDDPLPGLQRMLADATELWRARSRVERGDEQLAESIFERHWPAALGRTDETALVIAEGLLRCRLARGDHAGGLVPALEAARLRRAGVVTDSYTLLPAVIDETLALCKTMPPTWAPSRGAERLRGELQRYDARGDDVIAAMAAMYLHAVSRRLDPAAPRNWPAVPDHAGAELLAASVQAEDPDMRTRAAARAHLQRGLDRLAPWTESWCRYYIGRSLLLDRGRTVEEAGLLSLAHLPARFSIDQPYLTGFALAAIIRGSGDGGAGSSESLRELIAEDFPDHPAFLDVGWNPAPEDEEDA